MDRYLFLLPGLLGCVLAMGMSATAMTAPRCGDFLAALAQKPAGAEFVGCEATKNAQLDVLRATYRVAGARTAAVEQHLVKTSGMARLRFLCCGWEPMRHDRIPPHQGIYRSRDGTTYEVSMVSGETLIRHRAAWASIPYFVVTVERALDPH